MLKPYQMSSVIITGPKNIQDAIIKELHDLQVLHIVDHSKNDLADIGMPLESANRLSELLVKARALIFALGVKKEGKEIKLKRGISDIESALKKLSAEVNSNLYELKKTEGLLSKNESVKQELEVLSDIDIPLENIAAYKSLAYFAGYVKNKDVVAALNVDLSSTTKNFMLLDSVVKKRNFILIFVDGKSKENVSNILQKHSFFPVTFSNIGNFKGTASSNSKKIIEENKRLNSRREELKSILKRLSEEYKGFLLAAEAFLSEQLEKAEAPLKFASTQSSFLIKGWIPTEKLTKSIERLNKAGSHKLFVHFEGAKKKDKVPVKLKNPQPAKSFEFFLNLYSMPTYKEIDPTFFIFITFPIFFGIMLGDVGYGLVSLALFWLLKRNMPKAKSFFNILMTASFVSILFGFLFGEFFGYEFVHPIVSREHEMFKLMYIAIAIGVVHVNIGLIAGFINTYNDHGLLMAIYEKASWIVLELGVAMLVLSYFKKIAVSPIVGAAFFGAAILLIFKGEGVKGIMELPGIFTNILSYARLMAIGLSSVILAVIINESATEFFHQGGFFVLIGILILVIGHIVNIMLGLLGSFLHSLRLHYVEFFSKFFHGGAEKYKPFGFRED